MHKKEQEEQDTQAEKPLYLLVVELLMAQKEIIIKLRK